MRKLSYYTECEHSLQDLEKGAVDSGMAEQLNVGAVEAMSEQQKRPVLCWYLIWQRPETEKKTKKGLAESQIEFLALMNN